MNDDKELNPLINVTISLEDDKFFLLKMDGKIDNLEKDHIDEEGHSIYTFQVNASTKAQPGIFFKCGEDRNCNSFKEYIKKQKYGDIDLGKIIIVYPGYKIQYDVTPPIYKDNPKTIQQRLYLMEDEIKCFTFEWETIKFKDQKSLFDTLTNKKTEYIGGHIKNDRLSQELLMYGFKNIVHDKELRYFFL